MGFHPSLSSYFLTSWSLSQTVLALELPQGQAEDLEASSRYRWISHMDICCKWHECHSHTSLKSYLLEPDWAKQRSIIQKALVMMSGVFLLDCPVDKLI